MQKAVVIKQPGQLLLGPHNTYWKPQITVCGSLKRGYLILKLHPVSISLTSISGSDLWLDKLSYLYAYEQLDSCLKRVEINSNSA